MESSLKHEDFSRDSRGGTGCPEPFRRIKENADIFSGGGESRHWVHTASPCKENGVINASVFSKSSHVLEIQGGEATGVTSIRGHL